jgi:flagellar biosynthesis chaperone FliJ
MDNYSKFTDINAVLKKAKTTLDLIEKKYNESLHDQEVSAELLVEIKDYLGNLRSALDYLRNKVSKYNFPICKTEKEFENATTDLNDDLKIAIKKWQPFQNNQWIEWFNTLNNKSKHITLIPQKRKEDVRVTVSSPNNGGSVSWGSGVTFGGGVSVMGVPIDPQTQMPVPNNIVKTEKTIWVSFEFEHENLPNGISALPFLKECFEKITNIITEIEVLIKQ